MRSATEYTQTLLYFFPRVVIVAFFLFCTAVMIAGNFPIFEPMLEPVIGIYRGKVRPLSPAVTIGPYPHEAEIIQLKRDGYGVIICLLNTSFPQEEALKTIEEKTVGKAGMVFYSVPLDYLDLNGEKNRERVEKVVEIIRREKNRRFYIHCYLGRHRVEFVRRYLLERGLIS